MTNLKTFILFALILLINSVSAKVALVVEFPNGNIYKGCVNISDGENGKTILEIAKLEPRGSIHPQYGFFLKCIKNFCDGDGKFWSFSLILPEKNDWVHSSVGIGPGGDLNNFCWNRNLDSFEGHYCSHDGDVLGFSLNEKFPKKFSFNELCGERENKKILEDSSKGDFLPIIIASIVNLFLSISRSINF